MLDSGLWCILLVVGPLFQLTGIFLSSIATHYWHLVILQGILQGVGNGMLFCPAVAILSTYFRKKRSIAIALAGCGVATGGLILPVIVQQLSPKVGFPWTLRVIGLVCLFNSVVANILSRPRTRTNDPNQPKQPLFDLRLFKNGAYSIFCISVFAIFLGAFIAYFYVSSPQIIKRSSC